MSKFSNAIIEPETENTELCCQVDPRGKVIIFPMARVEPPEETGPASWQEWVMDQIGEMTIAAVIVAGIGVVTVQILRWIGWW